MFLFKVHPQTKLKITFTCVMQVLNLRNNVKTRANNAEKGAGLNKRKVIEKSVADELCAMLDSGVDEKKLEIKKGQPNVVMFVGLQGSGKTTTCSKYGAFYKKKGFKPALVCADTFRAGASRCFWLLFDNVTLCKRRAVKD